MAQRVIEKTRQTCPDDGACHHRCLGACFRVLNCAPLSGAFNGGDWPKSVMSDEKKKRREWVV
jgi:hypothetical protein